MLTIGSLFTGYGGLDLAVEAVLDARTAWTSDIDPGACRIIDHRWPDAPNLGDIAALDWATVEPVDVLTGGFPCQDVSHAGARRGLGPGTRSGLWSRMADAIDHLRPSLVIAENVRGLLSAAADSDVEPCPWCLGDGAGEPPLRALGAVLADLAELGYDASWYGLRAADVGAPHGRFRVFVLAWPAGTTPDANGEQLQGIRALSRLGRGPNSRALVPVSAGNRYIGGRDAAVSGDALVDAGRARAGWDGRAVPGAPARSGWPDIDVHTPRDARRDPATDADRHDPTQEHQGAHRLDGERAPLGRRPVQPSRIGGDGGALGGGPAGQPAPGRTAAAGEPGGSPGVAAAWGPYEPAIRRWECSLGRAAPAPTEPGSKGQPRLSPRFVEWLMGLPAGWVTDVPGLSRNDQLKALGNGVVPQQAAAALTTLLAWRAVAVGAESSHRPRDEVTA